MIRTWFEAFKLSWAMMTAIPLFNKFSDRKDLAGKSVAFYPLVGLVLGLMIWVISIPIEMIFPETVAPYILFVLYTLSYGALHTDGLADILDALLSYKPADEAIKILKDPNIGAQGAVYLFLFLILKAVLFSTVSLFHFIAIPLLSRFAIVIAMKQFSYLSSGSMAKSQTAQLTKTDVIIAASSVLFIFPFAGLNALFMIPLAILTPLVVGKVITKRLGGLNGDSYGTVVEITELVLLLLLSANTN